MEVIEIQTQGVLCNSAYTTGTETVNRNGFDF